MTRASAPTLHAENQRLREALDHAAREITKEAGYLFRDPFRAGQLENIATQARAALNHNREE